MCRVADVWFRGWVMTTFSCKFEMFHFSSKWLQPLALWDPDLQTRLHLNNSFKCLLCFLSHALLQNRFTSRMQTGLLNRLQELSEYFDMMRFRTSLWQAISPLTQGLICAGRPLPGVPTLLLNVLHSYTFCLTFEQRANSSQVTCETGDNSFSKVFRNFFYKPMLLRSNNLLSHLNT